MNLLFICDEYPPGRHGGIGTAVQLLARAMVRLGHHVVVAGLYDWGYGGESEETDEGVVVYRYRRKFSGVWAQARQNIGVRIAYRLFRQTGVFQYAIRRSMPGYASFLEKVIATHQIEAMEVSDFQDYAQHLIRYLPLPQLSLPFVVKLHGTITSFRKLMGMPVPKAIFDTEKALLQRAQGLISVSRFALQETEQTFGISKPSVIIPNGIDLTEIPAMPEKRRSLEVVFSGTLVALKGIYQLMKAWNSVVAAVPDARLLVYGKGALNRILPLLTPAAKETVDFRGHVSRTELLQALTNAPVAVFPSYVETFGLAALEAMACGCAVVYTTRAAGPEVIRHNEDGLLADPDDVAHLAQSVIRLLQNPELCTRLGATARQRVYERFGIDAIAAAHVAYYKGLISAEEKQ